MNDQNNITKIDNTNNNKSKAKKTSTLEAVLTCTHKICRLSMSMNRREAVGNQSIARSMMWGDLELLQKTLKVFEY
jgi:hypothetical protein